MGDQPHPEVAQGALTEGRVLGAETVQHQLPALVHHGQCDRVPIADVTIGLQQRREGQQPRIHRLLAARLRAMALGQYVLKVCVEERMAVLAQKHKNFRVLRVRAAIFCSSAVKAMGGFHLMDSQGGRGTVLSSTSQSTDHPLLSTLYEPLPKHLISVLGVLGAAGAPPGCRASPEAALEATAPAALGAGDQDHAPAAPGAREAPRGVRDPGVARGSSPRGGGRSTRPFASASTGRGASRWLRWAGASPRGAHEAGGASRGPCTRSMLMSAGPCLRVPWRPLFPTHGTGSATPGRPRPPAMAAGLTEQVWPLREVLLFRVPPWPQPVGG